MDHRSYPLPNSSRFIDDAGLKDDKFPGLMKLSTPISYIASYQKDPLNPQDNKYRYFSDGKSFYILVSNGPDMDIDIDERLYTGDLTPIQSLIYDSSNGLQSSGDIVRTNQGRPGGRLIKNVPPFSPPAPVEVKKATGMN
ncbi:hypothetical protein K8I31_21635 [bacterium]|nr:hypothetical protein [bacterium]